MRRAWYPTVAPPPVVDLLIAATASVHGLPLYTQNGDFEGLPGVDVIRV